MVEFFLGVTVLGLLVSLFSIYIGYREIRQQRKTRSGIAQPPGGPDSIAP